MGAQLQDRTDEFLTQVRGLIKKSGMRTAEAFLEIARGKQPDQLTKKRLTRLPVSIYLQIDGAGNLQFSGVNKLIALRVVIKDGDCSMPKFGPANAVR